MLRDTAIRPTCWSMTSLLLLVSATEINCDKMAPIIAYLGSTWAHIN